MGRHDAESADRGPARHARPAHPQGRGLRPAHGYAIARWIEQATDDVLRIEEGSLYPALHRLEARGWIEAEWGASENNRRAKYYSLTAKGRAQLRVETTTWTRFANAVFAALDAPPMRA